MKLCAWLLRLFGWRSPTSNNNMETTMTIANQDAPYHAGTQCHFILKTLVEGGTITNMWAITTLNASSGGSRLRNVVGYLRAEGIEVQEDTKTNPGNGKKHKIWWLGRKDRPAARKLLKLCKENKRKQ